MDDIRAQDRLIVALDFDSDREAMNLVKTLGKRVGFYKIGWQLFPSTGWSFVRALADEGKKIFLDLKIGDIDETVRAAVKNMPLEDGNLELLTIQGNGATVNTTERPAPRSSVERSGTNWPKPSRNSKLPGTIGAAASASEKSIRTVRSPCAC